jgi:type VI secretion system protein VasD
MSVRFNRNCIPTAVFLVAALLQLGGCASPAPPSPTSISAKVIAASDANLDAAGRPLPIVVRIYELKSSGSFEAADFYSLYNQDRQILGEDLLAREEANLQPGERIDINRPTDPGANYLGVIGAFREIDGASWRAVRRLAPNQENAVEVKVTADAIFFGKR